MKTVKYLILIVIGVFAGGAIYVYSGAYPMGADVPHNKLTYWLLETVREQSIKRAAQNISVPSLDDPEMLLAGGPDYYVCRLPPKTRKNTK